MTTLLDEVNVIDCSAEETVPQEGSPGSLRWLAKDLRQADWYFELQDSVLDELRQLGNFIEANLAAIPLTPPNLEAEYVDGRISTMVTGFTPIYTESSATVGEGPIWEGTQPRYACDPGHSHR